MTLTFAEIRGLQPRAKAYKVADQQGLYLLVKPSGTKLWGLKYRFRGVEKKLSLGQFPEMTPSSERLHTRTRIRFAPLITVALIGLSALGWRSGGRIISVNCGRCSGNSPEFRADRLPITFASTRSHRSDDPQTWSHPQGLLLPAWRHRPPA